MKKEAIQSVDLLASYSETVKPTKKPTRLISWLFRYTATVLSCVAIIVFGITAISKSASVVTTSIGENISTNNFIAYGNATTTGNHYFGGIVTMAGNLSVDGNLSASIFTASSTSATSTFPYLTSTQLALTGLTAGSVPFIGTGGIISQNNANFYWDNTNSRLGIGTTTPQAKLDILDTSVTSGKMLSLEQKTSAFSGDGLYMNLANGSGSFTGDFLDFNNNGTKVFGVNSQGKISIQNTTDNLMDLSVDTEGNDGIQLTMNSTQDAYHTEMNANGTFMSINDYATTDKSTILYSHSTSNKTGDFIQAFVGVGAASFTGDFLDFNNNGTKVFGVNSQGKISIQNTTDNLMELFVDTSGNDAIQLTMNQGNGNNMAYNTNINANSRFMLLTDLGSTNVNTITLSHASSSKTGDLIYSNMAAGSGSFSGDFLDFNVNSINKFKLDNNGGGYFAGNVGIGTTSPTTSMLKVDDSNVITDVVHFIANSTEGNNLLRLESSQSYVSNFIQADNGVGYTYWKLDALGQMTMNSKGGTPLTMNFDTGTYAYTNGILMTSTGNDNGGPTFIKLVNNEDAGTGNNIIDIYQGGIGIQSGNLIYADMADGIGSFTGDFFNFWNAGTNVFRVNNNGAIIIDDSIGSPYGITLTMDSTEGTAGVLVTTDNGAVTSSVQLDINDNTPYAIKIDSESIHNTGGIFYVNQNIGNMTGDLLYANIANGSGSFSGDFLDFNVNSINKVKIDNSGGGYFAGNVGIGTTTPGAMFAVQGNALADAWLTYDVAEMNLFAEDQEEQFDEGDLLSISDETGGFVKASQYNNYPIIGVAKRVEVWGSTTFKPAILGTFTIKVSTENGNIYIGDYLTKSSVPGVAMRANDGDPTVGFALEEYSGDSIAIIKMFINVDKPGGASPATLTDTITTESSGFSLSSVWSLVIDEFKLLGITFKNGLVKAREFVGDVIKVKKVVVETLEMKDSITGETYCVVLANGEWKKTSGTCGGTVLGETSVFSPISAPEPAPAPLPTPPAGAVDGGQETSAPDPTPEPTPVLELAPLPTSPAGAVDGGQATPVPELAPGL